MLKTDASKLTLVSAQCHVLIFCPKDSDRQRVEYVLQVIKHLSLAFQVVDQCVVDAARFEALAKEIGPPKVGVQRRVVLICGAFLEEQVSIAAQCLLGMGYTVYLLREAISSRSPEHAQFHDLRLVQMGAVPTTLRQMLYEWLSTEQNTEVRTLLLDALEGNIKCAPR